MTIKVHKLPAPPLPPTRGRHKPARGIPPADFPDAQKGFSKPRWHSGEWTAEEDQKLRDLASQGASCNCIGHIINRQPGSVWLRMQKLGVEIAQKEFDHRKAYLEIAQSEAWRNVDG